MLSEVQHARGVAPAPPASFPESQQRVVDAVRHHLGRAVSVVPVPPRSLGRSTSPSSTFASGGDVLWTRRPYARGPVVVALDPARPRGRSLVAARALASDPEQLVVVHALEVAPPQRGGPADHRIGLAAEALRAAVGPGPALRIVADDLELALLAAERDLGARVLVVGAGSPAELASAMRVAAAATGPVLMLREDVIRAA